MVLILGLLLSPAVISFSRRSIIDSLVSRNRDHASQAEALARGGLQVALALLLEDALAGKAAAERGDSSNAGDTLDDIWALVGDAELVTPEGDTLTVHIRDAGARLNLNALVDYAVNQGDLASQADQVAFMKAFLGKVLDESGGDKNRADELGKNLIDYIDPDRTRVGGRGDEDAYYQRQSPPYRAANRPLLSIDELAMIEGFDADLVRALRPYVTVFPQLDGQGINVNTAPPHVLTAVYHGTSGDKSLLSEPDAETILKKRETAVICDQIATDKRCISLSEVRLETIYPAVQLPASSSVFMVTTQARVGELVRTLEAVIDRQERQVLTWRWR